MNQYRLEAWPDEARRAVLDRDHGVCAACGRDCEAVQGRLQHVAREALRYDRTGDQSTVSMDRWLRWKRLKGWLTRFGLPIDGGFTVYSLWHHHHIIPVCRDGLTVLANLQTLCVCCHKAESRKLATDRALTKRATNG